MFFYIYKTTNKINGKIYIGKHQTNNLDDGYLGSGYYFRKALKKYGAKNFEKEIICFCESLDELNAKEKEIVNKEFVEREDTYNLTLGGGGGGFYLFYKNLTEEERKIYNKKISDGIKLHWATYGHNWVGKHHKEETKQKISEKAKIKFLGEGNSQYGTKWIYNLELKENKKIMENEELPDGWNYGRIEDWSKLDRCCIQCGKPLPIDIILNTCSCICDDCKEKRKQSLKDTHYNEYINMHNDYNQFGWKYVQEKYNYTKSRPNFIQMCKKYIKNNNT